MPTRVTPLPAPAPTPEKNAGLITFDGGNQAQFYNTGGAWVWTTAGTTERARIDSSGDLHLARTSSSGTGVSLISDGRVFTDSPTANSQFTQRETSGGGSCIDFFRPLTTNSPYFAYFGTEASFTTRGSIFYNRTTGLVNFATTSDERLKKNIQEAPLATAIVEALKVRQFDWKDSGNHLNFGFVAQELYEVAPFAVSAGTSDEEDIGKAPWSVDNSTLVPMLVKAMQEQQAIINSLKARLDAANL